MKTMQASFKKLRNVAKVSLAYASLIAMICVNTAFAQNWNEVIKVAASDRGAYDNFGYSVAISGDYAIVGAMEENHDITGADSLFQAGSAYIFKNNGGIWTEMQKIAASDREAGDNFGFSVAISGDYAIIGSPSEDDDATGGNILSKAGSAYVFKNIGGAWVQTQKIVALDRGADDNFGRTVAISGDYTVIGAYFEDQDAGGGNYLSNAGSAYIFKNNGGVWSQVQKIVSLDRGGDDRFGNSLAISGDYVIIGARNEDEDVAGENTLSNAGSAYIYKNNGGIWSQAQKIVASDRGAYDFFGSSVAISEDYAIVGAYSEDQDALGGNTFESTGSAYIFKNNGGIWLQVQKIVASDRGTQDYFGSSVAISRDYAIVGAYWEDEDAAAGNTLLSAGSAYIFKNNGGSWSQVQKMVASDRGDRDEFGVSVAISGDYAIVGAWRGSEDTNGGNPLYWAGSAYIFKNGETKGIVEYDFGDGLVVYPNPTNGNFSIDLGDLYENTQVQIKDIYGKLLDSKTISQSQVFNMTINQPAGVYFVTIQSGELQAVIKLVKE